MRGLERVPDCIRYRGGVLTSMESIGTLLEEAKNPKTLRAKAVAKRCRSRF